MHINMYWRSVILVLIEVPIAVSGQMALKVGRSLYILKLGSISTHQLQVPYKYNYLSKPLLSIPNSEY